MTLESKVSFVNKKAAEA